MIKRYGSLPKKAKENPQAPLEGKLPAKSWGRKVLNFLLWAGAGFILVVVGVLAYFTKDLPSPENLSERHIAESTKILDRTGQVILYEIHGEEKRTNISFAQMPDCIKKATLAAEDADFYKHHGLDFKAIARAALEDIKGQAKTQGASTITQQLIKNSILSSQKTFTRKIKEAILSLELEQKFEKDEILEMYLNEIPYGSNAYGIESASQTFFGKNAASLDLAECSLITALPKAPTYYSPFGTHTEELKNRQAWVLQRMVELGYISNQEAKAAAESNALRRVREIRNEILAPHFVMFVKDWLVNKYGEDAITQGGFKVITTLDYQKQQWAEEAITKGAEKNLKNYNSRNAALVSLDPKNGEILSMVGSKDYFDKENDGNVNVATRLRQPGSSFKPFAYAVAFSKGYSPDTKLFDVKTNFKVENRDYTPQNFNGSFSGPVSMREALANSLNIPAVKTLYLAGVKETVEFARSMGITTLNDYKQYGLALVLGGGGVTLLDETSAFGTFANDGIRVEPQAVLRVEDTGGKAIYEKPGDNRGKRVVASDIARTVSDVLSDNGARSRIFGSRSALYIEGHKVAAKSGTTQEFRDGWTLGYTPNVATGVWTGNNNSSPTRMGEGVYTAGPIWNEYMRRVLETLPKEEFPSPPEIKKPDKMMMNGKIGEEVEVKIDEKTGLLAKDDCPKKCTKKKIFSNAHCILYYVDRLDPLGQIPKNPEIDPQFKYWEEGVQRYYAGKDDDKKNKKDKDKVNTAPPTEKSCSCED
ncbi:MAG: PBP1A family penicillin-binding protein [Candidatus Moranbacteria bacterium]|nr:PBP1A family penicillin-binding protein [Candidatus Moranbacteria bacterium]